MDASFFSKPLSQLECRDNKKSCHLLEKKGTHPMRMHDNNTTCNRSNQNAGFLDTTNTTCNRSNQNARLPDTHSHSTNQHPATPDTTKTMYYRSMAQCWKEFLVDLICLFWVNSVYLLCCFSRKFFSILSLIFGWTLSVQDVLLISFGRKFCNLFLDQFGFEYCFWYMFCFWLDLPVLGQ